jgi:hypothetical protein
MVRTTSRVSLFIMTIFPKPSFFLTPVPVRMRRSSGEKITFVSEFRVAKSSAKAIELFKFLASHTKAFNEQ